MPLVLIVDEDRRMRRYLRATLMEQRYRVVEAESGSEGLTRAAGDNPDVVVMEFSLPDLDGIQVTTKLREWTPAPILILSAYDQEDEKVAALDAGANDFLTRPFGTREFLARIRVWLRHIQRADADSMNSVLEVGDLRLDFEKRLAFVGDREVRLTPTLYKLFGVLMRNAGKALTYEQILFTVWGPAYTKEIQYLRVYMGKLRQTFEQEPACPRYFVTEHGVGYRLRRPEAT